MKLKYLYPSGLRLLLTSLLIGSWGFVYAQEIPITTESEEAREIFVEARVLFDNLRFDEAAEKFDQALQEDPEFALANVYRALSSATDADFSRHLAKAASKKSEISDGERLLIESVQARSENLPIKSIQKLEEAVESYPQDKRLRHTLGLAYQWADKIELAEEQYEKAIALDSNFAPPYNNLGYLYRDAEQYDKAEVAFKNYIRILPDEANPHDSMADLYTKMGEHDLAIAHYQKALELNPNFYFSQQKIGDNLMFKGRFADGRISYEQAMDIAPTASQKIALLEALAASYLYEDDYDKAREETMAAIERANKESLPENAATLYQVLAVLNLEIDDVEEAESNITAGEEIMKNANFTQGRQKALEVMVYRNKAVKYAKQGNFEKAMNKVDKLKQRAEESLNPYDMEMYHQAAGIVFYLQEDYSKAIESLKQIKNSPYSLFYLAKSYEKNGNENEAKAAFKKVANWNEHSVEYAMVRNKARESAGIGIASEIEE